MAAHSGCAARPLAFIAVASGGFVIQMAIVAALTRATSIPVEAATAARAASGPSPETIRAWDAHIAGVERAQREAQPPPPADAGDMRGRELRIPGGIIHEWSGSVVIRGIGVPELIDALTTPGTPPPEDDVLESRVLAKSGGALRVFLKLRRTAIVTVTYDTEHDVTFTRHTPAFASSRSVATSIREAGGGDRGFLWRLNSYWTYRAAAGGVHVDVLSVSLSRDAPALVRPVALPVASRIARESMRRTLDAMRQFGERLASTHRP